jgi:hypothetical protein
MDAFHKAATGRLQSVSGKWGGLHPTEQAGNRIKIHPSHMTASKTPFNEGRS